MGSAERRWANICCAGLANDGDCSAAVLDTAYHRIQNLFGNLVRRVTAPSLTRDVVVDGDGGGDDGIQVEVPLALRTAGEEASSTDPSGGAAWTP